MSTTPRPECGDHSDIQPVEPSTEDENASLKSDSSGASLDDLSAVGDAIDVGEIACDLFSVAGWLIGMDD